jgi:uncharacterized repeat protein (TIGR03843 family)
MEMDASEDRHDSNEEPIATEIELERALRLLLEGEIELQGQLPWSSNYSFLVDVFDDELSCSAVYKPQGGERPLWDFPDGTLCIREYAAFVVSEALGWSLVPPTVLRDGPYGLGSVQLYVDADPDEHFFYLRDRFPTEFMRVALFDVLVNNADRKGGHCLRDGFGHIWCIDHGLTFNSQPKLRTVIWDYAGQSIPPDLLEDLSTFKEQLAHPNGVRSTLERLLSGREMKRFERRLHHLLESRCFPEPGPGRNVPWPMV